MSKSTAAVQRCGECDGIQPLRARECEVCGAALDGSHPVEKEESRPRPIAPARAEPKPTKPKTRAKVKPAHRKARAPRTAPGWGRVLRKALLRELRLVLAWSLLSGGALIAASLALTFAVPGGAFGDEVAAAWSYLRQPLWVAAAVAWGAGACYDLAQVPAGRPAWSGRLSYADYLLGVAVPGAFVLGASQSGAVPPSAWQLVPLASAAGFIATLAVKFLADRLPGGNAVKLAGLLVAAAVLAGAWLIAPRSDVPGRADQRALDRHLEAAIPMTHCSPRPIDALPAGLFRNSLAGLIHCHQGRLLGVFIAFHNSRLLDIYVSQRQQAVDSRPERGAARCNRRSGAYTSNWFKLARPNRDLGAFICYGRGRRRAVIQWADTRSDVFGTLRGRGRPDLYRWWRGHQVDPRFRRFPT